MVSVDQDSDLKHVCLQEISGKSDSTFTLHTKRRQFEARNTSKISRGLIASNRKSKLIYILVLFAYLATVCWCGDLSSALKKNLSKIDNDSIKNHLQITNKTSIDHDDENGFSFINTLQHKRSLADSGLSIKMSTLTASSTSISSGSSVIFTLQGKDSSGNNLSSGGEVISLVITNQCTDSNGDTWTSTGAYTTLEEDVVVNMTDTGTGTYTYTHVFAHRKGVVSAYARKLTNNRFEVYAEGCSGCVLSGLETQISYSKSGIGSPFFVVISGYLFSTVAGNFNLYYEAPNSFVILSINGVNQAPDAENTGEEIYSFSLAANEYKTFDFGIEGVNTFNCKLSSNINGPKEVMNYAFNPSKSFIGNNSLAITVACDTYHTDVDANDADACVQIPCGNGVRDGTEEWDDGNNISSDGCSDLCAAELNYICTGGSSTSKGK